MKKLALIGMVVAGLLLSSSIALAKPTGMTNAEYQALITRSQAMNLKYGQYEYAHPVAPSSVKVTSSDVNQKLEEIGAWAVPSTKRAVTPPTDVNQKLEEIGAWAVPSKQTGSKPLVSEKLSGLNLPTGVTVSSSGQGFDWNDAGIGALAAMVGVLCLGGLLTVRHQHHRPIPH
jgi:hypothetical protein